MEREEKREEESRRERRRIRRFQLSRSNISYYLIPTFSLSQPTRDTNK
jgi:hypothetical protein